MNVSFPIIELFDRYTIAKVKFNKTKGSNHAELEYYQAQVDQMSLELVDNEVKKLQEIHEQIWILESELKSGCEQELSLEEIGRRAITIRNWNSQRILIKNHIADILNKDSVREIKKDHLSQ